MNTRVIVSIMCFATFSHLVAWDYKFDQDYAVNNAQSYLDDVQQGMSITDSGKLAFSVWGAKMSPSSNVAAQAVAASFVVAPKLRVNCIKHGAWYAQAGKGQLTDIAFNNALYPIADVAVDKCLRRAGKHNVAGADHIRLVTAAAVVRAAQIGHNKGFKGFTRESAADFASDAVFQVLSNEGEKHFVGPVVNEIVDGPISNALLSCVGNYLWMSGVASAINYGKQWATGPSSQG